MSFNGMASGALTYASQPACRPHQEALTTNCVADNGYSHAQLQCMIIALVTTIRGIDVMV